MSVAIFIISSIISGVVSHYLTPASKVNVLVGIAGAIPIGIIQSNVILGILSFFGITMMGAFLSGTVDRLADNQTRKSQQK